MVERLWADNWHIQLESGLFLICLPKRDAFFRLSRRHSTLVSETVMGGLGYFVFQGCPLKKKKVFVYLAAPSPSCGMWDPVS